MNDKSDTFDLLETFNVYLGKLNFNKSLKNQIEKYRFKWSTHNNDRIEFLGGNSIGTTTIRYSDSEVEELTLDILNVDLYDLKEDIHALKSIDTRRIVTSNAFLLLLMYLIHRFINSKLSKRDKESVIKEIYYIFAYKILSSLFYHYFRFLVDKEISLVVTERLTNKFLIKKLGNWHKVLEYRAKAVSSPDGLHYDKIKKFDSYEVQEAVADMQGRLRSSIKNIYKVLIAVKNSNSKVLSTSLVSTFGEEESIGDIEKRADIYIKYLKNIIYKQNDFVKIDIVNLVDDITDSKTNNDLKVILDNISSNYIYMTKEVDTIIEGTLESFIGYMNRKKLTNDFNKDIQVVITSIKNYFSNSKINDDSVKEVKEVLSKLYPKITRKYNKTDMSGARIRVMLYITIRAIAMHTYK